MKAVVDTNVIVSALLSKRSDSPTVRILRALMENRFTPLYAPEIIAEYRDVLSRPNFHFPQDAVSEIVDRIVSIGVLVVPGKTDEQFIDPDDKVFYCVALVEGCDDTRLITGNLKHFPSVSFIVSPAQFCEIMGI